jgi:ABC-type multidrug transport system ATPase subunit
VKQVRRADFLLEVQLTDRANQMVRGFSGGMMQRLDRSGDDARPTGTFF